MFSELYFYVDNREWQPVIRIYKLMGDHPLGKQIDILFEIDWENKGKLTFYSRGERKSKMITISKDYLKEHGKKLEENKEEFFDGFFDIIGRNK
jgi:hypothetical protein